MEEVRAILNVPNVTTRLGIRDRAMMHLCFAAGLRVSELVGLPLENLSLQRTPSIRVLGKGRKERCLPLRKETANDLRAWLAVRGVVFVSNSYMVTRKTLRRVTTRTSRGGHRMPTTATSPPAFGWCWIWKSRREIGRLRRLRNRACGRSWTG